MYSQEHEIIISALQDAYDRIDTGIEQNSGAIHFKNRIKLSLMRDINAVKAADGNSAVNIQPDITVGEARPLKRILGQEVKPKPRNSDGSRPSFEKMNLSHKQIKEQSEKTSEDIQGEELANSVDMLYPQFLEIETDQIRDKYSDFEILGVATKAGLPVTEKTKVDIKLINIIKDAIKKKKELDEKAAKVKKEVEKVTTPS